MRRKRVTFIVILVIALASAYTVYDCAPWGERHTEIDVNSGRIRVRVFILGIMVSEKERETPFSQLVAKHTQHMSPARYDTATVTDAGPGRLRRCYGLGAAFDPMDLLPKMIEATPSLREREGAIVTRMLEMLRQGDTEGMSRYVTELMTVEDGPSLEPHPDVNP